MNEQKPLPWQRLGGYAILLLAAFLLLLGWRSSLAETTADSSLATNTTIANSLQTTRQPVSIDGELLTLDALPVISDTALSPDAVPQTYQGTLPQHEFQTYIVKRGDTPNAIAERFGIAPETLLGGNPFLSEESSLLQTGVELIILPIDGVLHDVQIGDTLATLSQLYGIPEADIIAYGPNNLAFPYRLYPDTQILVPGAIRELFVWTPPTLSSVGGTSSEGSGVKPLIVGTGTFVYPVSSRNFTQFYWYGHRGVDIALAEGPDECICGD